MEATGWMQVASCNQIAPINQSIRTFVTFRILLLLLLLLQLLLSQRPAASAILETYALWMPAPSSAPSQLPLGFRVWGVP